MTSSVQDESTGIHLSPSSSNFISGYDTFKAKYPLLDSLHKNLTQKQDKKLSGKKNDDGLKNTNDIRLLQTHNENMNHLKNINLRRTSSITKSDRPPLSTNNLEGRGNALLSKITLKSFPKRRSVSSDRRTTYRKCLTFNMQSNDLKDNDLTCPICLDILYRPRELNCGHLFCLVCLQSYSNACLKYFSCPSCRQIIKLPENGVSGLPRKPSLERIANQLNEKKKQMVQKAKICVKCHSDLEVKECGHCGKGWCCICQPQHLRDIRNEVIQLKETLVMSREKLLCKQEEEETKFNKLEDKIMDALELKKEELLLYVKDLRKISQKKIQKLSVDLENALQHIFLENEEKKSTLEEEWKQYHKISQMIASVSSSIDQRVSLDTSSFTLTSNNAEVNTSPQFSSSRTESKVEDHSNDMEEETFVVPKDLGLLYRKKASYSKYRWGQSICRRPAGIAVSPWSDHLYITASDSCKVHIFDQNGKQISSFGSRGSKEGCFLCPIGINFSLFNNELYITDKWKHCIHVFDCDGRFVRQIGKKGKGFGEFSSPEGIATDLRGNIYVADTCNDRVQILDKDGVHLREVGLVSSEFLGHGRLYTMREFNEPVGVAVSADGSKIYVADSGNHRIRVFDGQTGERLLMFGSRGTNRGQFESPESVTVDENGFIIVGDSGNGRIQVFRPNGRFVRALGTKGGKKGEFGWVSGLVLTKNKEIIVTDFKYNTIAVF